MYGAAVLYEDVLYGSVLKGFSRKLADWELQHSTSDACTFFGQ